MLYTHETRVCLMGYGPAGNKLFGFQFSSSAATAAPLRLPRAELPVPPPGQPPLGPHCVRLLALYGRLFCAHVDEARARLCPPALPAAIAGHLPLPGPVLCATCHGLCHGGEGHLHCSCATASQRGSLVPPLRPTASQLVPKP